MAHQVIQQLVSVTALELFPLDAKRMAGEDLTPTMVALVKANSYGSGRMHYDALLALAVQILMDNATKDFLGELHGHYCGLAAAILHELDPKSSKALHVLDGEVKILEAAELAEQ